MKHHILTDTGAMCGCRSAAVLVTAADCAHCLRRLDAILDILIDTAAGQDVRERAQRLVQRLAITTPPNAEGQQ